MQKLTPEEKRELRKIGFPIGLVLLVLGIFVFQGTSGLLVVAFGGLLLGFLLQWRLNQLRR